MTRGRGTLVHVHAAYFALVTGSTLAPRGARSVHARGTVLAGVCGGALVEVNLAVGSIKPTVADTRVAVHEVDAAPVDSARVARTFVDVLLARFPSKANPAPARVRVGAIDALAAVETRV